jgi:hypothetical protein
MKTRIFVFLLLGLLVGLGLLLYFIWPRTHVEIQPRDTKRSPDGQWVAVVQLEAYDGGWAVTDAVYAVRLKKAGQENLKGDLVMTVPVNYPVPEPSIRWRDSTLLIALSKEQNYQYFVNSVNGVDVVLQRNEKIVSPAGSKP